MGDMTSGMGSEEVGQDRVLGLTAGARAALVDLVDASGLVYEVDERALAAFPDDGALPLSTLDGLVLVAEAQALPLSVVEAGRDELAGWLGCDVPLLTALEGSDGGAAAPKRWLVVRRAEDGGARVATHDEDGVSERRLSFDELLDELDLAGGRRLRWVKVGAPPHASVASSEGEPAPLHPLRRLLRLIGPDRSDVFAVVTFAVVIGVLLLATPVAVQALVNFVALGGAIPPLIVVVALLFLGLSMAGLLSAFQTWVVEILQRRVFVRSVADLSARLPRAALTDDGRFGPELVNRFFDLETIQKRGSFLLLDGLSVLLSVLVGLAVLAFYHPLLLAFDILLVAVIVVIVLGPIRRGIRTSLAESSAKYEVAAWLEEIARNPTLFKSSGVMRAVFERSDRLVRSYVERRATHFRVAFGQGVAAIVLQIVASTALLGIGGLLVMRGSLTLGQLVAAELILTLVVTSLAKIGKHLEAFYDLMAATDKLGVLLDMPVERDSGEHYLPAANARGTEIELRSVGWSPDGAAPLFSDVSLDVRAGERVALRGPSEAGKSVIFQLIWGLRAPSSGHLLIDGRDLRELSLESLRRAVGYLDRTELFEGTVRENVRLGRRQVSDEDVRVALRRVGLLEDLRRLPAGLDSKLTSDGRPFSGGQIALLQVARMVAGGPRLLLVTDVFSELDANERSQVLDVLFDPDAPWTLVVISNAPDVWERCDRTYVLDHGSLTEATDVSRRPA